MTSGKPQYLWTSLDSFWVVGDADRAVCRTSDSQDSILVLQYLTHSCSLLDTWTLYVHRRELLGHWHQAAVHRVAKTQKAKGERMFIIGDFLFSLPSHPGIKVPRGQFGFFFPLYPKDDLVTFRSEQGAVSNVCEWSQGVGQVACNFPPAQREFFSSEFPGSPSAYPGLDSHRGIHFCFSRLTIPFPRTPSFYKWCWHFPYPSSHGPLWVFNLWEHKHQLLGWNICWRGSYPPFFSLSNQADLSLRLS